MDLAAVVLAAGKGTRMKSKSPKVLHRICDKPMVSHVIDAVEGAGVKKIVVVVGYGGEEVKKVLGDRVETVFQEEQLGTAHALLQARPILEDFTGRILVVCGDTPLITSATLKKLADKTESTGAEAAVLTACLDDPSGYGRIIRDSGGNIFKIVEQKDAGPGELAVKEINTGIYCFSGQGLFDALAGLSADNIQGEFYLTDIIERYKNKGRKVGTVEGARSREIVGVNDRLQLARAAKMMRKSIMDRLMVNGVTIVDPDTTYVGSEVVAGVDTVVHPFSIIEGKTNIGEQCSIGPYSRLVNCTLGKGVKVEQSTVLHSVAGDECLVGPFSYIRPGCVLGNRVKIGDFVELKKVSLGDDSKVPHLTYLGDSEVGKEVNVGAGTITCNYDGRDKHRTYIGDGAFIGSNTNLVAPVRVGEKAVIGAGSTITKDVPPAALGVARSKQRVFDNWKAGKDTEGKQ